MKFIKSIFIFGAFLLCSSSLIAQSIPTACQKFVIAGNPGHADQYLCKQGYLAAYDYNKKVSDWVAYTVSTQTLKYNIPRKDKFKEDTTIPKQHRATLKDFAGSGFHRGHQVNYEVQEMTQKTADESFLLSNMTHQVGNLNVGRWKSVETRERKWAATKELLYIYAGPVFGKNYKRTGPNKVAIPTGYFKIIYAPKQKQVLSFYFKNEKAKKKQKLSKYLTSIHTIQQKTGYKFLTALPSKLRTKLVNQVPTKLWPTRYKKTKRSKGK
tara:strand:- start:898 stop:1701 length:804 start_codon:yes stop_codon:yes gene_type:complete